VAKYHDEQAVGGHEHHLVVAVHPSVTAGPDADAADAQAADAQAADAQGTDTQTKDTQAREAGA
jgi:hypothetical protein